MAKQLEKIVRNPGHKSEHTDIDYVSHVIDISFYRFWQSVKKELNTDHRAASN